MSTEAQAAAAGLPGAHGPDGMSRGARAYAIFGVALLFAMPVALSAFLLTLPWGWAAIIVGILLWALCAAGWSRVAPDQVITAAAVDEEGVVHVLAGATMVTAHRRMLTTGVARSFARGALLGFLLGVVAIAAAVIIAILLAPAIAYLPFLLETLAALIAMAVLVWHGGVIPLRAQAKGMRVLDPAVIMPLLGLYAKRNGDHAAVGGIPADRLVAVAESATPEETAAMSRQSAAVGFIRQVGDGSA